MSIAFSCTACFNSRQSVAIMLVAVGRPVAARNSAMISRPENPPRPRTGLPHRPAHRCLPAHSRTASSSDHAPFGSSVIRASGKRSASADDRLHLLRARQHAALQLEVAESIPRLRRLGQPQHGVRRQRFLMPQPQPRVVRLRLAAIRQVGLRPIADKEQIAQHIDARPLLPFPQQRRHRQPEKLPQQIEQRRFNRRHRMDGGAQIERLQPAPFAIADPRSASAPRSELRCTRPAAAPPPASSPPPARGESSRRPAPRRRPCVPQLSVSNTTLRVKKGACAPLRFSSMLSCPATGITRMAATSGVRRISPGSRMSPCNATGKLEPLDLAHNHQIAEDRHQRRQPHKDQRIVERAGLLHQNPDDQSAS